MDTTVVALNKKNIHNSLRNFSSFISVRDSLQKRRQQDSWGGGVTKERSMLDEDWRKGGNQILALTTYS